MEMIELNFRNLRQLRRHSYARSEESWSLHNTTEESGSLQNVTGGGAIKITVIPKSTPKFFFGSNEIPCDGTDKGLHKAVKEACNQLGIEVTSIESTLGDSE